MKSSLSKLQTKLSGWPIRTIKLAVFVVLGFLLFRLFETKVSTTNLIQSLTDISGMQVVGCLFVIIFMPLNWSLEAIKWQLLLQNIQRLSFKNALSSVISGTALGNLSPFMIGDFVGRLRLLQRNSRAKGGLALLVGNGIQTYVLLIFGLISWLMLLQTADFQAIAFSVTVFLSSLILLGTVYFFKIFKLPFAAEFRIIGIIDDFQQSDIVKLIAVALLRQVVFSIQFIILLKTFSIQLPFHSLFALVSLIFFFKTIGSFAGVWGDMALRQLSAVYLFGLFAVPAEPVLIATTLLWLINIFVPMIGGIFVLFFSSPIVSTENVT